MPIDATSANGKLILMQVAKTKPMSKKFFNDILIFDDNSGKKTAQIALNTIEHTLIPSSVLVEGDGSMATGGMFFDGQKVKAGNSDGFYFMKIGADGKISTMKKHYWERGLQSLLNSNVARGALASKPKIVFHSLEKNGNEYQLIGETFTRSIGKTGVALTALSVLSASQGGGGGIAYMHTLELAAKDFLVMDLGEKGSIKNAVFVPKEKRTFEYQPTIGGGMAQAILAKAYGLFSFSYVTTNAKGENIMIYSNKEKGIDGKYYIGIVPLIKGAKKFNVSKIRFEKKASKGPSGAVKAKPGHILFYELNKKEKVLTMWLRKLDIKS
jgi:hypothetical protein